MSAELSFQPDGTCYIEWIQVDDGEQGRGIGTGVYERIHLFAKRHGAQRIQAVLTTEESLRAAINAYGEGHTTEVVVDEEGRRPGEDGYLGPDHQNWLLQVDLDDSADGDHEKYTSRRQELLRQMGIIGTREGGMS